MVPPRYVVLGLGNRLQRDEALGGLVVDRLSDERARLPLADHVEVIDGGTVGLGLLPYLVGLDGLIVVDAINAGEPPGTVIDLDGLDLASYGTIIGIHDLGVTELLGVLAFQGELPRRVRVVGAQPATVALGTQLSPPVAAAVPRLCEVVRAWLAGWAAADREMLSA